MSPLEARLLAVWPAGGRYYAQVRLSAGGDTVTATFPGPSPQAALEAALAWARDIARNLTGRGDRAR